MRSTFYVAVHTRVTYDPSEYATEAGRLVNTLERVFLDKDTIALLTKGAPLTACSSSVEVVHEDAGLVARLILDIDAATRVPLEKSKLSALLREHGSWPNMKVEKRTVHGEADQEP